MVNHKPQREQILDQLKDIIFETIRDWPVNVYLFGSWARHEEKRTSDIDIAFCSQEDIPINKWVELKDRIEESSLPYRVDLVELSKANNTLKEMVMKEGVLWKGYVKESHSQEKL